MAKVSDQRIAEIVAEICEEISNIAAGILKANPNFGENAALQKAIEIAAARIK